MMTKMINFPTLHVPQLLSVIPEENMSKMYVFTDGIPGPGPYGGGPFMFQIDVFDSIPIQKDKYSQYRVPYLVRWNESATARVLTSEEAILQAEKNRELTVQRSEVVINAPIIVWNGLDGEPKILPNIGMVLSLICEMLVRLLPRTAGVLQSQSISHYRNNLELCVAAEHARVTLYR